MEIAREKKGQGDIDSIESILVFCWGLIGDVFLRVPLIEALRRRFPAAYIVVIVDPQSTVVLENHPDCDRLIPLDRPNAANWRHFPGMISMLRSLRRRKFDLSVDLYGGGSSPRASRFVNAEIRLSFGHTVALRRASNLLVEHPPFSGHWSRELGVMLGPLGIATQEIRRGTSFYCSSEAQEFARGFVAGMPKPLVAFNLGAGSHDKRWPVERFVALARAIGARHGFSPLVFTNPGMEDLARQFESLYGGGAVVAPMLSLDKVGALMQECSYVITGDTSLMHLAFGLKRPTLVLFTFTRPEMVIPEDCLTQACFVESTSGQTYCGKLAGSIDIAVSDAVDKFDFLHSMAPLQGASALSRSHAVHD